MSTGSEQKDETRVDVAALLRWLLTWVQPNGAIYGFHNHSVWGGNPYRWTDFTCGHSTWASPLLPALAEALRVRPDERGQQLLERMLRFQAQSFQDDGNFKHIGFQVGESLKVGLIHNAIALVSMAQVIERGNQEIAPELIALIETAFKRNPAGAQPVEPLGVANQEYARLWSHALRQAALHQGELTTELRQQAKSLIDTAHVGGFPDDACEATYRVPSDKHTVEPAEYYGLMILPLMMLGEQLEDEQLIEHAARLARHVVRSSWRDSRGCVRLHRLWWRRHDKWVPVREPMLIAGSGDTLEGVAAVARYTGNAELQQFVDAFDATYATYQHPAGFFAAATGWQSEVDVVPSSAWHGHDARYLVRRHQTQIEETFWDRVFATSDKTAVLLGDQCFYVERGLHWAIGDYAATDVFKICGRKDHDTFGRDMSWVGGDRALPKQVLFESMPKFVKTDQGIYLTDDAGQHVVVTSIAHQPFFGTW